MIRHAAVAGTFYDADPEMLRGTIDACFLGPHGPGRLPAPTSAVYRNIVGLICPHAGYRFSGYAAAAAFFECARDGLPDTVVLVGPNHRGIGPPAAVTTSGTWRTPLGEVQIDTETARKALEACDLLCEDNTAHLLEHSIEVQVPFLQHIGCRAGIVPIVLSILPWEDGGVHAENIGRAIAAAVEGKNAVIVASTDFTHYEPKHVAEEKDRAAIAAIEALDHRGLLEVVGRMDISMCGVVPTAAVMFACSKLGAKKAELLAYYTSGDIIGDASQVVGYGALKIVKGAAGAAGL